MIIKVFDFLLLLWSMLYQRSRGLFGVLWAFFCFSCKLIIDKAVFMFSVQANKYLIIQEFINFMMVINPTNLLNPNGGSYELNEGI